MHDRRAATPTIILFVALLTLIVALHKASRRLLVASKDHGEGAAPATTARDLIVHVNDELDGVRTTHVSPSNDRVQRIRLAAYRRAEARGFTPGAELEDWLAAEQEVDSQIA